MPSLKNGHVHYGPQRRRDPLLGGRHPEAKPVHQDTDPCGHRRPETSREFRRHSAVSPSPGRIPDIRSYHGIGLIFSILSSFLNPQFFLAEGVSPGIR